MTRVCECESWYLISTNTRNSLTICVSTRICGDYSAIWSFLLFPCYKMLQMFPIFCVLLYYSVVCCGLFQLPLKAVITIVGCCRWQNSLSTEGVCKGLWWKLKCQHWTRYGEDQCVGVFWAVPAHLCAWVWIHFLFSLPAISAQVRCLSSIIHAGSSGLDLWVWVGGRVGSQLVFLILPNTSRTRPWYLEQWRADSFPKGAANLTLTFSTCGSR